MNRAVYSASSFKSYATGFILAIVLTGIPFALVMQGMLPHQATVIAIFGAAILQILVHLHYFLHLDATSAERWNVMALLLAFLLILLFVGGSLWIMYNLNYRLM